MSSNSSSSDNERLVEEVAVLSVAVARWLIDEVIDAIANSRPLVDSAPSDCVKSAVWDPETLTVTFTFHKGRKTYEYRCTPTEWIEYRSSASRGDAFNAMFAGK